MVKLKVKSIAPGASAVEDIIIRESGTTRLLLRPIIVDNDSTPEACVKGAIIYQKKNDEGEYKEDKNVFDLRKVKKGEFAKLELKSEEVLTLLQKYEMLKELYKKEGFNFGETTYCITEGALGEVLEQISKFEDKGKLLKALEGLQNEDVNNLTLMVSVGKIDKILGDWELNKNNASEEFWQKKFEENNWVLSQIFACPYVYIDDKPYVGGKSIENTGGSQSDFLMKQSSSENIAFIEIKTPVKELMGNSLYRGAEDSDRNSIYPLSNELSGSINQVLNQRDVFLEKKIALEGDGKNYKNPKCVIIIGKREGLSEGQLKNFDLFRHNFPNLEIITFDELFERITSLKKCFMGD